MKQTTLSVPAMCCDRCVRAISGAVADVKTVAVDLASRTVRVGGDADPAAVRAAIEAAGYAVGRSAV